jgi:hypothetical protein
MLSRIEALARFDLKPGRPTLLVFGGSRGARNINRALMGILPTLLSCKSTGDSCQRQFNLVRGGEPTHHPLPEELRAYYRPYPYLHEDMGPAFRSADLVVARAGASMLGEGPAFDLPAISDPADLRLALPKSECRLPDSTRRSCTTDQMRALIDDTAPEPSSALNRAWPVGCHA